MKCQHEGCTQEGNLYAIYGYDPEPEFWFCDDHAADFGFCTFCGKFIGGTEDVFLTGQEGLCFDCYMTLQHEMEYSMSDYYDDEEEYEDY